MLFFRSIRRFTKFDTSGLSARKYMRSISESALHYRPDLIRQLNHEESIRDRVVQQFFDSSSALHRIQVFQASNRLSQVDQSSTPAHSYYQVVLPFKDNQILRKKMIQFVNKNVRVGRILQLMDYIAANVAYRYCSASSLCNKVEDLPFMAVTAAIDEIDFFHPIMADTNCAFSGYVSYVGTSSMEVQIAVTQEIQGKEKLSCSAKFVMVARDKKTGKSYKVPALELSNEPQNFKIIKQLGQQRQITRKLQGSRALKIAPPTYEESTEVHNLIIKLNADKDKFVHWMKMGETIQRTTLLMHLQDKNLSGKIFGGFILRLAYELGWLTAYKFLKGGVPKCTHIDDVQFLGPVEIGSIVELESVISYIDGGIMHVIVQCKNTLPPNQTHLTNILRINFEHESTDIRRVYPVTMSESSQYIESMRRVKKYLSN